MYCHSIAGEEVNFFCGPLSVMSLASNKGVLVPAQSASQQCFVIPSTLSGRKCCSLACTRPPFQFRNSLNGRMKAGEYWRCCRVKAEGSHRDADLIDSDGLPHVGAAIWPGQHYYNTVDKLTGGVGGCWRGLNMFSNCGRGFHMFYNWGRGLHMFPKASGSRGLHSCCSFLFHCRALLQSPCPCPPCLLWISPALPTCLPFPPASSASFPPPPTCAHFFLLTPLSPALAPLRQGQERQAEGGGDCCHRPGDSGGGAQGQGHTAGQHQAQVQQEPSHW